jgi:hypothetical protein
MGFLDMLSGICGQNIVFRISTLSKMNTKKFDLSPGGNS